jgi:hypothetical protein
MSFIPGMRAPEFASASMNLHYSLLFFGIFFLRAIAIVKKARHCGAAK